MKCRTTAVLLALAALSGCKQSVQIEVVEPDAQLEQAFNAVFRSEGHTNRLGFFHVQKITKPSRVEYSALARDLDHPELSGGPSLTMTKKGEKWAVLAFAGACRHGLGGREPSA